MLSLLHHPNLVTLLGYCTDGDQRLLVYEYMPMGSLETHLFGTSLYLVFYGINFFDSLSLTSVSLLQYFIITVETHKLLPF